MKEPSAAFDHDVTQQLRQLQENACMAFAASCAERLVPCFSVLVIAGEPRLREGLELVWRRARSDRERVSAIALDLERLLEQLGTGRETAFAVDAVATLLYGLRAAGVDAAANAAYAGRRAHEAADALDSERTSMGVQPELAANEIFANRERQKQMRDLALLSAQETSLAIPGIRADSARIGEQYAAAVREISGVSTSRPRREERSL